jgi:YcaO-like protein with predicted kinase domain
MLIFGKDHSQRKAHFDGTHRMRSPEETLRAYSTFMPQLGITRLANVTGLDCVRIPVVQAIRPNSRSLAVSQGKGIDVHAARASALMESIELWHAEHVINPLRYESYQALRRTVTTVDLESLPLRRGSKLYADRPILWVEGWDVIQQRPAWVPFEVVNLNTVRPPGPEHHTFFVSSNGLASGNHLLEALEHALGELIERDAIALHFLEGTAAFARCKVDLASVEDPVCRKLLGLFREAETDIAVWDATAHCGVPTFCAAVIDAADRPGWRRMGAAWGYGTHLSPLIALARALTEAAQSRLTLIAGSREDNPYGAYSTSASADQIAHARQELFAPPPVLTFGDRPSAAKDTFEGDVETLIRAVCDLGVEMAVVVDLTQPHINIPVVKVIVPGLEMQGHGRSIVPGRRARARMERSREPDSRKGQP